MTAGELDGEAAAARRLAQASTAIVEGVERELSGWVQRQVAFILDAWGRLDPVARAEADGAARNAGRDATVRVVARLRDLFSADPAAHTATPLEIVRTAYREPTAVLESAGVPAVERDAFDERAWPDDRYGLVPRTLGDLGDADLAPLMLAWGMAKAGVLRARVESSRDQ
jgi:hypothetical protein